MRESLLSVSLQRFKKNVSSYISVGIFAGLFLILGATLSFVDASIVILAIPLLVMPFLFASHVACYFLEANQQVNISSVSRYFFGFFRPQFRGSFRGIKSFLISLAVYFGFMILAYVIFYSIFRNIYGEPFVEQFRNVLVLYSSNDATYEDLLNALHENNDLLLTFFIYVSTTPVPFAVIWFIYSISFNSLSIYYRLNLRSGAVGLIRLALNATYSRYRNKMRADWFKLNWPLLVLSLVGSIVGGLIAYFLIKDILYFTAIVTLGSVGLLFLFLPLYFSNMEVIYMQYESAFKEGNKMAVDAVLARIQTSIDLSEEERKSLEESFKEESKEEE